VGPYWYIILPRCFRPTRTRTRRQSTSWFDLDLSSVLSTNDRLAPQVGFEPTTLRLTAECSTIELLRSTAGNFFPIITSNWPESCQIDSFAARGPTPRPAKPQAPTRGLYTISGSGTAAWSSAAIVSGLPGICGSPLRRKSRTHRPMPLSQLALLRE
jgi:hypothetical protein